ncbi:MAG: acyltransferase [Pseudobutyrivibrio sp.]|nr:acyltransferase [Pseudobutyrivibrio sp.]
MKTRSGNVDLARFIAALLIMAHHIYYLGCNYYPFKDAGIYVEFFLLMTGYYTAKHYGKAVVEDKYKDALVYTVKKFKPLFLYLVIATVSAYLIQGFCGIAYGGWSFQIFIRSFYNNFLPDLFLLSTSYAEPLVVPLWYISGMIIVFPIFCLLVQLENRYLKIILCSAIPIFYYGKTEMVGIRTYPHGMLRILIGMMVGVLIYELSVVLEKQVEQIPKWVRTTIEVVCFIFPIYGCYNNFVGINVTSNYVYFLEFMICLFFAMPGFSHTSEIKGKAFNYLGELSMLIFIFHWPVAMLINAVAVKHIITLPYKIIIYYVLTIGLSVCLKERKNKGITNVRFLFKKNN